MEHKLKTLPKYFNRTINNEKLFEVRYNDRDFQTGDSLIFEEWSEEEGYTSRYIKRRITYVLTDFVGLKKGYVVLGLGLQCKSK